MVYGTGRWAHFNVKLHFFLLISSAIGTIFIVHPLYGGSFRIDEIGNDCQADWKKKRSRIHIARLSVAKKDRPLNKRSRHPILWQDPNTRSRPSERVRHLVLSYNSGGTDAATNACAEIRPGILDLGRQGFGYGLSSLSVNTSYSLFLLNPYGPRGIGQKVTPKSSHSHAQSAHKMFAKFGGKNRCAITWDPASMESQCAHFV